MLLRLSFPFTSSKWKENFLHDCTNFLSPFSSQKTRKNYEIILFPRLFSFLPFSFFFFKYKFLPFFYQPKCHDSHSEQYGTQFYTPTPTFAATSNQWSFKHMRYLDRDSPASGYLDLN